MATTENPAIIVVIEDNPADVRLLRYALDEQTDDYVLRVLRDGEEALEFVQEQRTASHPKPCVIVLDLHLPRYDGTAVLRAIKEEPVLAHVHVAVITSFAHPEEEREVLRMGVQLYRSKPSDFAAFAQLVSEILEICKGRAVTAMSSTV